jgi:hypothetical protein
MRRVESVATARVDRRQLADDRRFYACRRNETGVS